MHVRFPSCRVFSGDSVGALLIFRFFFLPLLMKQPVKKVISYMYAETDMNRPPTTKNCR